MKMKTYVAPCGSVEVLSPCDICGAAPAVDTCPGGYRCGQAGNCMASSVINRLACWYTGCEHHPAHVPGGPHPDHPQEWDGIPDCADPAPQMGAIADDLPNEYVEAI